jgi:hypothetical protein
MIEFKRKNFSNNLPLDKQLLQEIRNMLPSNVWDDHMHKEIADKLGISHNKALTYIQAIRHMDKGVKPKRKKIRFR